MARPLPRGGPNILFDIYQQPITQGGELICHIKNLFPPPHDLANHRNQHV